MSILKCKIIWLQVFYSNICNLITRDVTINSEPAENWFKHVTIQIGWDAKRITIQLGVGVHMNVCLRGTYCL